MNWVLLITYRSVSVSSKFGVYVGSSIFLTDLFCFFLIFLISRKSNTEIEYDKRCTSMVKKHTYSLLDGNRRTRACGRTSRQNQHLIAWLVLVYHLEPVVSIAILVLLQLVAVVVARAVVLVVVAPEVLVVEFVVDVVEGAKMWENNDN